MLRIGDFFCIVGYQSRLVSFFAHLRRGWPQYATVLIADVWILHQASIAIHKQWGHEDRMKHTQKCLGYQDIWIDVSDKFSKTDLNSVYKQNQFQIRVFNRSHHPYTVLDLIFFFLGGGGVIYCASKHQEPHFSFLCIPSCFQIVLIPSKVLNPLRYRLTSYSSFLWVVLVFHSISEMTKTKQK